MPAFNADDPEQAGFDARPAGPEPPSVPGHFPRAGAAGGFGGAWLPGRQPFNRSRYLNQWVREGTCLTASEERFDGFVREASPQLLRAAWFSLGTALLRRLWCRRRSGKPRP